MPNENENLSDTEKNNNNSNQTSEENSLLDPTSAMTNKQSLSSTDRIVASVMHESSDTSLLRNLFYFLIYIPIKWSIIFGLVYAAYPLGKAFYKACKTVYKYFKKMIDTFISMEGAGFMSGLIKFFKAIIFLLLSLIFAFLAICLGAVFGIFVYIISLIINI
tara:strand:+ start:5148 stop:5633 length:486 start_codon:yes stop_codon:yes gene_type:complete